MSDREAISPSLSLIRCSVTLRICAVLILILADVVYKYETIPNKVNSHTVFSTD